MMKNFLLILGWAILLVVLLINRLAQPMSDSIVIILCLISSISLIAGILIQKTNRNKIKSIWYEFEETTNSFNKEDFNTDVIFELDDGSKWVVSFFTYKNIETLRNKNENTGECLNGKYFCSTDMVLISFMSKELIQEVIKEMISLNELELYCTRL